ncbi:MAG: exodeoxyribonuclease VII large subunit [Anaerolineae bacterium]|nr:exodeoxyribonuclease VII large subunit [Anaerolineae bacterium]
MRQRVYSVSEITGHIKQMLDREDLLQDLWLEGEISNWSRSRSGHCYFTIKDAGAAIRAVIWRSLADRLTFSPQDGQAVRAHGRVSVYEPQGQYQFYVDAMQPAGRGALYAQYEALKEKLAEEGLFAAARKRALPTFPRCIGIVTSATGAALRDILNVLRRRWPMVRVVLSPTLVQGDQAPAQIVAALDALYARDDVDVIIVGRGGGAIEDLWAFNDEAVARAIAASPVPVIAGVGHEVDVTIADFVADVRAPTPSAAAELAVPDQVEVGAQLSALSSALADLMARRLREIALDLQAKRQALRRASPALRLSQHRQRVDDLSRDLERLSRYRLTLLRERAAGLCQRLAALDPQSALARGYAIVRGPDERVVRSVAQVHAGDLVTVTVVDGRFGARVEER